MQYINKLCDVLPNFPVYNVLWFKNTKNRQEHQVSYYT